MGDRRGRLAGLLILTVLLLWPGVQAHGSVASGPPVPSAAPGDVTDPGPTEGGTVLGFEVTLGDEGVPEREDRRRSSADAPPAVETPMAVRSPVAAAAVAQEGGRAWYLGVRGGAYFDADEPFLGVEGLLPLRDRLWFNPNLEWVFVSRADLYTINFDVHYDLQSSGPYSFWVGGGLALVRFDPPGRGGTDTDAGLNLLGGVAFSRSDLIPYLQAKFLVDDDTEFVLAGGIRF